MDHSLCLYGLSAALTMVLQIFIQLPQCEGLAACSASLAKAAVWATVWPAYWLIYTGGLLLSN